MNSDVDLPPSGSMWQVNMPISLHPQPMRLTPSDFLDPDVTFITLDAYEDLVGLKWVKVLSQEKVGWVATDWWVVKRVDE